MRPGTFCIGGVDQSVVSHCHLIRFVDANDIVKCKAGTVLVGSVSRNRRFDDERADNGECSVTIEWPNESREGWQFRDDECLRYTGLKAGKKFRGIKGCGGLTLSNYPLVSGNPLSLSLSAIPRSIETKEKQAVLDSIRANLGLPKSTPALCCKSPKVLFQHLTCELSAHLRLEHCLVVLSGSIRYEDRLIRVNSFREFKDTVDSTFHSGMLDLDRLFLKPRHP